jgi:hypothetical protein
LHLGGHVLHFFQAGVMSPDSLTMSAPLDLARARISWQGTITPMFTTEGCTEAPR